MGKKKASSAEEMLMAALGEIDNIMESMGNILSIVEGLQIGDDEPEAERCLAKAASFFEGEEPRADLVHDMAIDLGDVLAAALGHLVAEAKDDED